MQNSKQPFEYDYINNQITGEKIIIEMNEDIKVEKIEPQKISSNLPFEISKKPSDNKKALIKSLGLGNNKIISVRNKNTNETAIVKDKTIEKSLSNTSVHNSDYNGFCIILNNIQLLFENSQKILSHIDTKTETGIYIKRYANIAKIGNKNYLLEFVLKDNKELFVYSVDILNNKNSIEKTLRENSMQHDTVNNNIITKIQYIFKSKLVQKYNNDYKILQKGNK